MNQPPTDKATECAEALDDYATSVEFEMSTTRERQSKFAEIIRRHMGDGMDSERLIWVFQNSRRFMKLWQDNKQHDLRSGIDAERKRERQK